MTVAEGWVVEVMAMGPDSRGGDDEGRGLGDGGGLVGGGDGGGLGVR